MKGSEKVIAALNEALQEELTAINQYFLHSEMCENWKYERIAEQVKKLSIQEMKHAEKLIERILFLDSAPNLVGPTKIMVGKTVKQQLENDLNLELHAIKLYNNAVKVARAEGDNGSANLLVSILKDEEEHADWQESQLSQIKEMGYEALFERAGRGRVAPCSSSHPKRNEGSAVSAGKGRSFGSTPASSQDDTRSKTQCSIPSDSRAKPRPLTSFSFRRRRQDCAKTGFRGNAFFRSRLVLRVGWREGRVDQGR